MKLRDFNNKALDAAGEFTLGICRQYSLSQEALYNYYDYDDFDDPGDR